MTMGRCNWPGAVLLFLLPWLSQFVFAEEASAFTKASNDSLLWGPYAPNLYFGIRPRIPKSVRAGLLWSRVEDFQSVQNSRSGTSKIIHPHSWLIA